MAISSVHFSIVRELFRNQLLPQRGALLALGDARWGDDVDPRALATEIQTCIADLTRQQELLAALSRALSLPPAAQPPAVATVFLDMFLAPREVLAIGGSNSPGTVPYDLNEPLPIDRQFQVAVNHGAAERTFDVAQVFITMHDRTAPGGLMLHQCAFNHWGEGVYYSLQPTLFFDLAAANGYQLLAMFIEDVANQRAIRLFTRETIIEAVRNEQVAPNTTLFAALVKGSENRPFQIPLQGYYEGTLSEEGMRAWREMR
jgi:hypothetical protein